ncbi:hypothetical protein HUT18_08760 [Streptomyces sp. NA04227]|uniref:hypothetical protein n=1 Tax=Streptomyces sp. NA04227 TaxID=2742136 RepID=UPI0015903889|nr:hypothetical protein [Streptomyces sp. NA04227]QKW06477.1 hypothetical protein HUT18_08760 [Streptomyces sp. NA04227]
MTYPRNHARGARTGSVRRRRRAAALGVGLAAVVTAGACGSGGNGDSGGGTAPGRDRAATSGGDCVRVIDEATGRRTAKCLPLAPREDRVDLEKPVFTHPTRITNPLHPTAKVKQVVYGGQVDSKPFRTEFTLLPTKRTIEVNGERVAVRTMQYMALSDGRIKELALDWFAQADDGAVWYLGEDVYNYRGGVVADTEGTWKAGKSGPAAMIMPAHPQRGDVYRPENAPEVVFEEVTVKSVNRTVPGPHGPVEGAVTVNELHMDGSREDKTFAPGYGEFSTSSGGDVEAVSVAVPTDARPGPVPAELTALTEAARAVQGRVTESTARQAHSAWDDYRGSDRAPRRLVTQMNRDIDTLDRTARGQDRTAATAAALRVAQNALDLRLPYEPLARIESDRMDLWARQLTVDAAARDAGAVAGDVTSLELTWERVRPAVDGPDASRVDRLLHELREAVDHKDTGSAVKIAPELNSVLGGIG